MRNVFKYLKVLKYSLFSLNFSGMQVFQDSSEITISQQSSVYRMRSFGCVFQFWLMYLRSMLSSVVTQMPCSSHWSYSWQKYQEHLNPSDCLACPPFHSFGPHASRPLCQIFIKCHLLKISPLLQAFRMCLHPDSVIPYVSYVFDLVVSHIFDNMPSLSSSKSMIKMLIGPHEGKHCYGQHTKLSMLSTPEFHSTYWKFAYPY